MNYNRLKWKKCINFLPLKAQTKDYKGRLLRSGRTDGQTNVEKRYISLTHKIQQKQTLEMFLNNLLL